MYIHVDRKSIIWFFCIMNHLYHWQFPNFIWIDIRRFYASLEKKVICLPTHNIQTLLVNKQHINNSLRMALCQFKMFDLLYTCTVNVMVLRFCSQSSNSRNKTTVSLKN